jgi:hypothetical protein
MCPARVGQIGEAKILRFPLRQAYSACPNELGLRSDARASHCYEGHGATGDRPLGMTRALPYS